MSVIKTLEKQLEDPYTKKDAEDCIKIYNWLKDTDPEGRVWESRWRPFVNVTFGKRIRIYKPNITGYTLLKGIESSEH